MQRSNKVRNFYPYLRLPTSIIGVFLALLLLFPAKFWGKAANPEEKNSSYSIIAFDIRQAAQSRIAVNAQDDEVIESIDFAQGGRPGEPVLPYSLTKVLVPPDANLATVQAQLSFADWEELPGKYEIAAAPPAVTWDEDKPVFHWGGKNASLIVDGKDSSIYSKDAYFPEEPVEIVSIGNFRRWKLVEVKVWRAAYNPVQKKIRVLNNAQTTVSVKRGRDTSKSMPDAATLPVKMLSEVVNPQDYETFYESQQAPSDSVIDYVIITTNTIQSNSTKLADFIVCKQMCGHTVKVVTEGTTADDTHYVSGSSAEERTNNIRTWLQSHYLTDGIEYVLLIGNPHPASFSSSTSIPMKMCRPMETRNTPTDMFFAELSDTWDRDEDGYYGEYYDDYYGSGGADKDCEVKVGRIPFYGSYVNLDSILQKTINYFTEEGDLEWRNKVLIAAAVSNFGPQDNNGDGDADDPDDCPSSAYRTFGDDWGEYINSLATFEGFEPYTLYEKTGVYSDGSAYPLTSCDAALNNSNFTYEWQNYYGFVTWWGHGSETGAYRFCWTSDSSYPGICGNNAPHDETNFYTFFDTGDCSQLDNTHPSFVVQVSCLNAYPEETNNLAYGLLKKGAVGTFAGTRVTWYKVGAWHTSDGLTYGDNASYGYHIFKRMAKYDETAATALNWCRRNFGTAFDDASWMNMIAFTLYGDPANHPEIFCSMPVAGDFEPDGDVDFQDFAVLASAWLSSADSNNWNPACDISEPNDNVINERDLDVFAENWLTGVE